MSGRVGRVFEAHRLTGALVVDSNHAGLGPRNGKTLPRWQGLAGQGGVYCRVIPSTRSCSPASPDPGRGRSIEPAIRASERSG